MIDKCANCKTTQGMALRSARGYWDGDTYLGGLCPNCVFYPERVSDAVMARLICRLDPR